MMKPAKYPAEGYRLRSISRQWVKERLLMAYKDVATELKMCKIAGGERFQAPLVVLGNSP
jgi:hypothetical protein